MVESPFNVSSAPKKARVEIIPLIDVIFFLLATFVLFTISLDRMRDVDVEMPIPGGESKDFTTLFLQASEPGTYYLKVGAAGSPELITAVELRPRIEQYRDSVERPRVFVRADRKAKMADALYALDQVRLAGIKQVSVETMASPPGS